MANSQKPLIINLFAGPGAGKTVAALELTAALKKSGYNVEYVSEYAKELVLEKKFELLKDQMHVTKEQYNRLDRLRNSGVEIIVTDSPVLLGLVYGKSLSELEKADIKNLYNSFDNFNLMVKRGNYYQKEGRLETLEEAQQKDAEIVTLLRENNIFYGNYHHDEISKTLDRINTTYKRLYQSDKQTAVESAPIAAVVPATQLDYDAVDNAFELIQEVEGVALLRSTVNEKYLVVADALTELEETRQDEYYLTLGGAATLEQSLAIDGQKVFESDEQKAIERFNDTLKKRSETLSADEKAYQSYLLKLRAEIGESDWLSYAMPREEFQKSLNKEDLQPNKPQATQDTPTYDIHETYHNDKLYEKTTPLNLRSRKQFVCWKYEWIGGKWKKVPYNPNTGKKASSVASSTWSDFETACKAVDKFKFDGVGIMFSKGLMGIDIDHCIDNDGKITDRAREVINTVNSYTELSPSGTGVHILAFGELPDTRTRKDEFEMYYHGRFFTLTGNLYEGKFRKIPKASETAAAINLMYEKYINVKKEISQGAEPLPNAALTYSDEEILTKCRKSVNAARFESLWKGDWSSYVGRGEQSSADAALIGMIAYYSDDVFQIDRLFRQSGLMRKKWDEYRGDMTYGQLTINNVLKEPNRPRYNPKYFYETHIKPKFEHKENVSEWTTIKLSKDNFIQDYQRCKNFKITKGELAGARFFYPSSMITETEDGYNLKVKNNFTFKVRPKNSNTDIELSCAELRQALSGKLLSKPFVKNNESTSKQIKAETEFE